MCYVVGCVNAGHFLSFQVHELKAEVARFATIRDTLAYSADVLRDLTAQQKCVAATCITPLDLVKYHSAVHRFYGMITAIVCVLPLHTLAIRACVDGQHGGVASREGAPAHVHTAKS